jgi:transcriptional regulator with XRE-family HTH domain
MKHFNSKGTVARIRDLRTARGLTQEQRSERIGYNRTHISRIECGCSIDLLITLAEFFDVSLDYLILGRHCESTVADDLNDIIEKLKKFKKSSNTARLTVGYCQISSGFHVVNTLQFAHGRERRSLPCANWQPNIMHQIHPPRLCKRTSHRSGTP